MLNIFLQNQFLNYSVKLISETIILQNAIGDFAVDGNFLTQGGNSFLAISVMEQIEKFCHEVPSNFLETLLTQSIDSVFNLLQKHTQFGTKGAMSNLEVNNSKLGSLVRTEVVMSEVTLCIQCRRNYFLTNKQCNYCYGYSVNRTSQYIHTKLVPSDKGPHHRKHRKNGKKSKQDINKMFDLSVQWSYDTDRCIDASPLVILDR